MAGKESPSHSLKGDGEVRFLLKTFKSESHFGAASKRLLGMFVFAGVKDAVMPSRASAVDDGFDFVGILVTSSPQKLQVEVAAIKSPQH